MADFKAKMRAFRRFILDLIFPAFCLGCKSEGVFLCQDCIGKIPRLRGEPIPGLTSEPLPGAPAGQSVPRDARPESRPSLDSLAAVSKYEDHSLLTRAIHELKYEFIRELAAPLSGLLAGLLGGAPIRDFVICPVPLHPKRLRWRGFNQAGLLAESVAGALGLPCRELIERTSFSRPQMELTQAERMQNVAGAFRCAAGPTRIVGSTGNSIATQKVLLIDDVATTRSTLNACAKALKEAGAETVCGIVLARTI